MKLFCMLSFKKFSREEKIHFLVNIVIGLSIVVILQFYEHTDFGEDTINRAFDYVIAKEAATSARSGNIAAQKNKTRAEQIIFIDLGSAFEKKGDPVITPRYELAKSIEAAYSGGAKVIVLDILLEDRDCCNPEHDRMLRKVFQDMIAQKVSTKVIFPVRIGSDGHIKQNLFQDLIETQRIFYPAIPYISATASDRIVRYWFPFETVNNTSAHQLLWNTSFLAAMLAHGKADELRAIGQTIKDEKARRAYFIKLGSSTDIEISADRDDLYRNRIRFFLIPQNTLTDYPAGNLFELVNSVDEVPYVTFRDKIVIIGNASPDAGDMHLTPAGNMPGMYVIGNALNTILLGLQPPRAPLLLNMAIELLVIILAAYFLSGFPAFIVYIIKTVALIAVLGIISYYWFLKTGVLLNFTFAIVGMGFYDVAVSIEKDLAARVKKVREKKT